MFFWGRYNMNKILLTVLIIVILAGASFFIWQYWPQSLPQIQPIVNNQQQEQNVTSETLNWKTYRQDGYEFEIKYPNDMGVRQANYSSNRDDFTFIFGTFYYSSCKEDIIGMTIKFQEQNMLGVMREAIDQSKSSFTEINVDGIKGTKVVGFDQKGSPVNEVWVTRDKQSLIYIFKGRGDTFDKMLSTFKFININILSPVAGEKWVVGKTYPIKWTISGEIDKVDIQILYGNAEYATTIAENIDAKSGVYNWTIPQDFLRAISPYTTYPIGEIVFRLSINEKIAGESYYGVYGISNEFSVISQNWVNWENLIPEALAIYNQAFKMNCGNLKIIQKADITGDGADEALMSTCSGGATSISLALFRIENGKPAVAIFKQKDNTIGPIQFLSGAGGAGRYAMRTQLLGYGENAIYTSSYQAYNQSTDYCTADAYKWNSQTKIFDYNASLSGEMQNIDCSDVCNRIAKEIPDMAQNFQKICK